MSEGEGETDNGRKDGKNNAYIGASVAQDDVVDWMTSLCVHHHRSVPTNVREIGE